MDSKEFDKVAEQAFNAELQKIAGGDGRMAPTAISTSKLDAVGKGGSGGVSATYSGSGANLGTVKKTDAGASIDKIRDNVAGGTGGAPKPSSPTVKFNG